MRHEFEPELAAAREHAGELLGRVAALAAVQAHADEVLAPGQRGLERGEGVFLAQVAQEAQDQLRADAQFLVRAPAGVVQAANDLLHRHAARGVRLRVEEDLCVHDVVRRSTLEVGPGHVEEVGLLDEHAGPGVVDVQEALQVGEGIGRTQRLHARVGQRDAVARRQPEDQLRLERALDVDVQLGLGHGAQQGRQPGVRDGFERDRVGHDGLLRNVAIVS